MATSGVAVFNLDFNDLAEEAWERNGQEIRDGYSWRTTRRSLNLLLTEWANRGLNMWLVEQGSIPMVQGQITYDLPDDTIDLVEQVIRTGQYQNQTDININRISVDTYALIPNKNAQGRPIQVWINRQSGADYPVTGLKYPQINVWPAPDQDNFYTFVYWRLRRIQDAGAGTGDQDIPYRFLPALVSGLAYYISLKVPGGLDRMPILKQMYDDDLQRAQDEDREKAPLRIAPRQQFIGNG